MKHFIGTKMIHAKPMTRGDYCTYRDWPMPADEKWEDEGYLVVYAPDGYESWSPKEVFEEAYRETDGMNFGLALEACKMGERIARKGWSGKGQYVFLAHDPDFNTDADVPEFDGLEDTVLPDVLVFRGANSGFQVGWLASQADMLADDWYIVE